MNAVQSFNRRVPLVFRLAIPLVLGIGLYGAAMSGFAMIVKSRGGAPNCTWPRTAAFGFDVLRHAFWRTVSGFRVSLAETDARIDLQRFSTGGRSFWIKRTGNEKEGEQLLAYLVAEHQWMAGSNGDDHVQPGDVVIDCGAHVGVFTDMALRRGASKVIAIEPDPTNLECLRRNLAPEIASGKVVVYPKGVWSSEKTLVLYTAAGNSGMNSMVMDQQAGKIEVPVTTLDQIVSELGIQRVNFIKMDIEGAEREALQGAAKTLGRDYPRLMLDSYHLPDDMHVLPGIIKAANPRYAMSCGPCEESFTPHVTYYR